MVLLTHPFRRNSSAPSFPGLYTVPRSVDEGNFIYSTQDVWQFTLLWTIILFEAFHVATALYAVVVQPRNWKFSWLIVLFYIFVGGVEALISGSIVGLILAKIYQTGGFRVSTWIPLVWGIINVFILTLSSFSIHGSL